MIDDRRQQSEHEEPPFVVGLLTRGATLFHDATRRVIVSIDRRVQMYLAAAGTVGIFLGVWILSIIDSPDFVGVIRGLFVGLFTALLFAVAALSTLLWANKAPSKPLTVNSAPGLLDQELAPTLRELNAVRAEVSSKVKARSVTRVPLGIAIAIVLWVILQWNDDPPGIGEFIMFLFLGAIGGEVWAITKLQNEYSRLYKNRVLPLLAARIGELTYREASHDEVNKLGAARILPEYDNVKCEDEIAGTHRGMPVEIVEVRLKRRQGKNTRVVFDGLLIGLTLPRSLTGTTVVLTDEGMFGNLKTRWRSGAMEQVRLEDSRFEARYEVYSNDQVEARALLTPAFMERFTALASQSGFSLPGALAEGNRLVIALPKGIGVGDLFEPPMYWKPAGGQTLVTFDQEIRAVLRMADTVIELDFWAAGRLPRSQGAR